jgi:uncharacterized integral membrane protein
LFVVFVVGPVALFAVQNWSRVSDVSFDYYAGKLQTAQPWPLPALLLVSFGVGIFIGLFAWLGERWTSRRRIADLESKLIRATADAGRSAKAPQTAPSSVASDPAEDWA